MFFKRKLRKAFDDCVSPDLVGKIPQLTNYKKDEKKQYISVYKNIAIFASVAIVLIVSVLTVILRQKPPTEEGKVDSFLGDYLSMFPSDNSTNESNISYDKIIYGKYNDIINFNAEMLTNGDIQYADILQDELSKPENKNNLFSVYVLIKDTKSKEDPRYITSLKRQDVLLHYSAFLEEFQEKVNGVLDGKYDIQEVIAPIKNKAYTYEISEYEAIGGFNKNCFDTKTINTVYKILNATEDQLSDMNFLKQISAELTDVFITESTITLPLSQPEKITKWHVSCCKSQIFDFQWQIDNHKQSFVFLNLKIEQMLSYDADISGAVYSAYLTKEQIESINSNDYGIYISFKHKTKQ